MATTVLMTAALLAQIADPPFLESTLLTPPSSVSRSDDAFTLSGAASQTDGLSRVGAQAIIASDWFRFKFGIAKVGVRDDAGFTITDGRAFTQAAIGLGAVVPFVDAVPLGPLELTPSFVFQASGDLTTEFDANAPNRIGAEAGLAVRLDVTPWSFVRIASTVEYELTGLIYDLGRDEAISGRHALELALSLPDREELGRGHVFVGIAAETPYSGYEKATAAFFTLGVLYQELFISDALDDQDVVF